MELSNPRFTQINSAPHIYFDSHTRAVLFKPEAEEEKKSFHDLIVISFFLPFAVTRSEKKDGESE